MGPVPEGELGEIIGSVQISMIVVFASCRKYLAGETEADIKALVKEGRKAAEKTHKKHLRSHHRLDPL